ncbi:MAG: SDR family oxidoreductase [Streptosporangiales bacterium]|nr:SDR family oxidoreductase [Streptosporangiales bacterium]
MTAGTPRALENQVAIVTGAGTEGEGVGVGRAIASVLAEQGARLVLTDIDAGRVRETADLVAAKDAKAITVLGDVSSPADCQRVIDEAAEAFGTVDILVNNAAASIPGSVLTLSDADWDTVYSVIVMGAVRMSRAAIPVMAERGHGAIVNISSLASTVSSRSAAYGSAKGALEALTRDMAVQHGRDGIRVNAVVPGYLNTPRVQKHVKGPEPASRQVRVLTSVELRNAVSPLGVEGNAWDVAWAVEYLASDRARFVTGVCLPVDGGVTPTSYLTMAPVIQEELG